MKLLSALLDYMQYYGCCRLKCRRATRRILTHRMKYTHYEIQREVVTYNGLDPYAVTKDSVVLTWVAPYVRQKPIDATDDLFIETLEDQGMEEIFVVYVRTKKMLK